jgi:hypothetical protein
MAPKRTLLLFPLLFLLAGCAQSDATTDRVEAVREVYRTMSSYTATAQITANCQERIYQYEADIQGTPAGGSLTVTAPENLAGCTIAWDEDGLVLNWEEVELDTGTLNTDGLTPVDAMAAILYCCTDGLLLECCQEAEGGELYAVFENPDNAACTAQCWFATDSYALNRAELTLNGETAVTLQFTTFQLTPAPAQEVPAS